MGRSGYGRSALGVGLAVVLLAGCGEVRTANVGSVPRAAGAQSNTLPFTSTRAIAPHPAGRPWMLPKARTQNLLYVSHQSTHVNVYNYDSRELVGELTVFSPTFGLCTDPAQHIYIPNGGYSQSPNVGVYKHGASKPFRTLSVPAFAYGCGINPTNGDLCVTSLYGQGGHGEVFIYKHANGVPKTYTNKHLSEVLSCAYDNSGDMIVVGYIDEYPSPSPAVAQLKKHESELKLVAIRTQLLGDTYDVKADGSYVALLSGGEIIDFLIHNRHAMKEGFMQLANYESFQFALVPTHGELVATTYQSVDFYDYPSGGYLYSIEGLDEVYGVAVSLAPSTSHVRK